MKTPLMCAVAFVVAAAGLASGRQPPAPPKTEITGVVRDARGQLLGGVDVAVYVVGSPDPVASDKTKPMTGKYSISASLTASFDILYTHARYHPCVVSRLASRENQAIGKVLYLKGDPIPASAAHDLLQSVERI